MGKKIYLYIDNINVQIIKENQQIFIYRIKENIKQLLQCFVDNKLNYRQKYILKFTQIITNKHRNQILGK